MFKVEGESRVVTPSRVFLNSTDTIHNTRVRGRFAHMLLSVTKHKFIAFFPLLAAFDFNIGNSGNSNNRTSLSSWAARQVN